MCGLSVVLIPANVCLNATLLRAHNVRTVGVRLRSRRDRYGPDEFLQPEHLALSGAELEALDVAVKRLPFTWWLLHAAVVVADIAHLQALVVRHHRVVAVDALRRDLHEHRFALAAVAGLRRGLAGPRRGAAVGRDQAQARRRAFLEADLLQIRKSTRLTS